MHPSPAAPAEFSEPLAAQQAAGAFTRWANDLRIEAVRWVMKADGVHEESPVQYAAFIASDVARIMPLIRDRHARDNDPLTASNEELAATMVRRSVVDGSVTYRTRGLLHARYRTFADLEPRHQALFEAAILALITVGRRNATERARRFNATFAEQPLPTTKAEADDLMASIISAVTGRPTPPPPPDPSPASLIDGLFAEQCKPEVDALAAAKVIDMTRQFVGGGIDDIWTRLSSVHAPLRGNPSPADLERFVRECEALALARYAGLYSATIEMTGAQDLVVDRMRRYLAPFARLFSDHMTAITEGRFSAEVSADASRAWSAAVGLYSAIWVEGIGQGQDEQVLLDRLWQST